MNLVVKDGLQNSCPPHIMCSTKTRKQIISQGCSIKTFLIKNVTKIVMYSSLLKPKL